MFDYASKREAQILREEIRELYENLRALQSEIATLKREQFKDPVGYFKDVFLEMTNMMINQHETIRNDVNIVIADLKALGNVLKKCKKKS